MPQYRKKPVVIEAMLFTDKESGARIIDWADYEIALTCRRGDEQLIPVIEIETLEGTMTADLGDWIIRGIKGEYYPCKPDIFAATYEQVERLGER